MWIPKFVGAVLLVPVVILSLLLLLAFGLAVYDSGDSKMQACEWAGVAGVPATATNTGVGKDLVFFIRSRWLTFELPSRELEGWIEASESLHGLEPVASDNGTLTYEIPGDRIPGQHATVRIQAVEEAVVVTVSVSR
ncbi:MAG: hypothetical protein RLN76_02115 [Phycisphaeraceae bacterium]